MSPEQTALATNNKEAGSLQRRPVAAALLLAPVAGVFLFVVLYVLAALHYPGGSGVDPAAAGFSWVNNYWCNLLNSVAINGQPNGGQAYAYAAMAILTLSLVHFWWVFARFAPFRHWERKAIQWAALSSMVVVLFIATGAHDTVINVSGAFGLVALAGTFKGLHRLGWKGLFYAGLFNFVLIVLNNVLYHGSFYSLLPVVQKITFVTILIWVTGICLTMNRSKAGS
jgi:hypothetical protein